MKITINGKEHTLEPAPAEVTYEKVVTLAGYEPTLMLSIIFRRGRPEKPRGILAPGQSIPLAEGMVFSVMFTGNA